MGANYQGWLERADLIPGQPVVPRLARQVAHRARKTKALTRERAAEQADSESFRAGSL